MIFFGKERNSVLILLLKKTKHAFVQKYPRVIEKVANRPNLSRLIEIYVYKKAD